MQITKQTTIFEVRILGRNIGKTKLRFYIYKNETNNFETTTTLSASTPNTSPSIEPDSNDFTHTKPRIITSHRSSTTTLSTTSSSTATTSPTPLFRDPAEVRISPSPSVPAISPSVDLPTDSNKRTNDNKNGDRYIKTKTTTTTKPRLKTSTDSGIIENPIFEDFTDEDTFYEVLPPIKNAEPTNQNGGSKSKENRKEDNTNKPSPESRVRRRSGEPLMTKEEYYAKKKLEGGHSTAFPDTAGSTPDPNVWWLPREYDIHVLSAATEDAYYVQ